MSMTENLESCLNDARILVENLRETVHSSSAVEFLVLTEIIKKAAAVNNDLVDLINAKKSDAVTVPILVE